MNWSQRIDNYERVTNFPKSLFIGGDGRVVGTWIMGAEYRSGGYPMGYLKRIRALFPDKQAPLHLFSGDSDLSGFPGHTVDLKAKHKPTYVDDAQRLTHVPLDKYDIVLCDPPYTTEDAARFKVSMVKRNVVMKVLGERLTENSHVVWLDQVLPMFRKDQFEVDAVIGMVKSTNHRFRVVTIFRKI